ncbi:MAG: hypothetical protein WCT14_15955 [Treponemataceae bacterium]
MNSGINGKAKGKDVYYSITWSALRKADRWEIAKSVPAVGGVYEIYWMDERKHLRLLSVAGANFGGLRSEIRRFTDPELIDDERAAEILTNREIFFRYAESDSAAAMADIVWFFRKTYFPENPGVSHSGRYERIFLNENAPDKVRWVE